MFLTEDLITFNLRNFLLFQLWESSFSPGAGGFCTTLPPSFLRVDDRATSSTTDSSRAPSSPRPPGSTSHCGISTGCTERCLCVLPLRTSQVPDVMAPQHDQEKFHDLAYSCLGKSFSMSNQDLYGYSTSLALGLAWLSWETKKKNVLHLVGLDSL
ncbi:LOW QUALITY PROTEIN: C1orf61 isoform 13 [Pan troglodytes]|uniref:C1orf61 isoform 13 n=2 Tax=Pan TaxID=9596 RepID=A0A2J8K5A8_PANTR|nr:LOW QUALITY PROTEIN: C1orf61 isoform 6 [Pan troglodytes]PNI30210.1 LOW QUALITY PROTEIN: C1orf61 isoform 13 [Pan troglodytes]